MFFLFSFKKTKKNANYGDVRNAFPYKSPYTTEPLVGWRAAPVHMTCPPLSVHFSTRWTTKVTTTFKGKFGLDWYWFT